MMWMNLESIIYRLKSEREIQRSQKEKDNYHILTHMSRKVVPTSFVQGCKGDTDIKNRIGAQREKVNVGE